MDNEENDGPYDNENIARQDIVDTAKKAKLKHVLEIAKQADHLLQKQEDAKLIFKRLWRHKDRDQKEQDQLKQEQDHLNQNQDNNDENKIVQEAEHLEQHWEEQNQLRQEQDHQELIQDRFNQNQDLFEQIRQEKIAQKGDQWGQDLNQNQDLFGQDKAKENKDHLKLEQDHIHNQKQDHFGQEKTVQEQQGEDLVNKNQDHFQQLERDNFEQEQEHKGPVQDVFNQNQDQQHEKNTIIQDQKVEHNADKALTKEQRHQQMLQLIERWPDANSPGKSRSDSSSYLFEILHAR